jgi:hypothetical protein
VKTIDDFLALLRTEVGLTLSPDDVDRNLDTVEGWDSVHLLSVLTVLERSAGRSLSLADALEATSLQDIYALAVAG